MRIKAILFDVIGTTLIEKNPFIINECFQQAFRDHGISIDTDIIKANRGKDKRDAINLILQQLQQPFHIGELVLTTFKNNLQNNLHNFSENEGLQETIQALRERNIIVGIGTGLPFDIFQFLFNHFNWQKYKFDYIGIAEKTGRGRPHPDMIFDMMQNHNLSASVFLKVGDTMADIQEGKNAKVFTAAILSGTANESDLRMQKPDFIIRSLSELINIVK